VQNSGTVERQNLQTGHRYLPDNYQLKISIHCKRAIYVPLQKKKLKAHSASLNVENAGQSKDYRMVKNQLKHDSGSAD
jgi:hypothetical protein